MQLYCIIKICSCLKFVSTPLICRPIFLKRKPIKSKTVISDIK